jgi:glycosyltransferase involved in cell wall biosynthesis
MEGTQTLQIIHITPSYKPAYCYGGPTMSVAELSQELRKAGLNIQVLTTKANGAQELKIPSNTWNDVDGVPVRYFSRVTKDHTHFSPALLIALYKTIKASRSAQQELILHVHSWWNLVAMLSTLIGICMKVPLVVSPRGMITSYTLSFRHTGIKHFLHKMMGRHLLSCVMIHATSEKEAGDIKGYLKKVKITVIPNLVDLPDLNALNIDTHPKVGELKPCDFNIRLKSTGHKRDNASIESKRLTPLNLLFLSRIDRKKGLELFFESLSKLTIPWHLSIAGAGEADYMSGLKQLTISLKVNTHINWLGQLDNKQKYDALRKHDLLVLVSKNENFANVVLESLSVGTPVMVSDKVGLASYICKSNLGWVCKTEADDIVRVLSLISRATEQRARIHCRAPAQMNKDYNKDTILTAYLKLYTSALKLHPLDRLVER